MLLRALLAFGLCLAAPATYAQTFTDVSDLLPEDGSGVSYGATIADADGDGRFDLAGPSRLLLQRDEGFETVSFDGSQPLGSAFADADRDGRPEALVLYAQTPDIYWYAPAREAFAPLPASGIEVGGVLVQGSVLWDYDADGVLDAFVSNDGGEDFLFRGLGGGTFEDVSALFPSIARPDYGAHAADYDRDGDSDLYIGVCPGGFDNILYRNDGPAGFADVAPKAGVADSRASWGVAWFDYDNDGWLDLYVANMPDGGNSDGTNGLFRNNADGTFSDVAVSAGVAGPPEESSWNVSAADFDNDGWTDLFVVNRPEPSRLYRNNGDGTFTDIAGAAGLGTLASIPAATGDVNGDGWVDIYLSAASNDRLFFNDGGTNGWLMVDLTGTASNRDGIGARVEVTAGDLSMVREITAGDGMMSQSHGLTAHFGLGTASTADVAVRWPSGAVDLIENVASDQRVTVVEGVGLNAPPAIFALTSPTDGALVPLGEAVTLAWEAAADDEAVTYTVHLAAPDGTDTEFETTESSFTVPASELVAEGPYRWAVVARDAYSARTSLDNASFTNNPNVANESVPEAAPLALALWPNPARETATVRFELATTEAVRLEIIDVLGRRVQRLDLGVRGVGPHDERLDLSTLQAGTYIARLVGARSGEASATLTRIE